MPAPTLRLEEPTFRDGIAKYVSTTCRLHGVPRQDVDDLVQETLINIVKRIGSFRANDGELDQWAKGVAVNVIRNHVRHVKRYLIRFSGYYPNVDDYETVDPSPEQCARQNQARCAIETAANGISSQQAQVFVLHAVHEMSHAEIGNELCISEAMSQKDYQRARNHLARCISGKAFSVMPPSLASCDDLPVNETRSRWTERSHYAGQLAAVFMAFFCLSSLNSTTHESTVSETRVLEHGQSVVMYRLEKPSVLLDAPNGKPEPASLPSVRDVSTPAKVVDKPVNVWNSAQLPPYDYDPVSADHHLFGDECP